MAFVENISIVCCSSIGNLVPTYLFPGGRALKLVKNSVNITNLINPLILTKNITLTVLYCYAPTSVSLVAHCIEVSPVIAASVIN